MRMLPKFIDPIRLCKKTAMIEGELSLVTLSRLQELATQTESVQVAITFGIDANKTLFIKGKIQGCVNVVCQRCNQVMQEPLEIEFNLCPVTSEARAKTVPEAYEVLMVSEEEVLLADIIEDEILLALPMVSRHENDCARQ